MLRPRKVKYRKWQKGRRRQRSIETKGTELNFGEYGLKALDSKWLTENQIEAMVREVKRLLGRKGNFWLRIFPDRPVTKKPPEVRMGGGKGDPDHYVFLAHPGRILLEISGVEEAEAKQILKSASYKLPIATKIVRK